jgi:uncharacterized protein
MTWWQEPIKEIEIPIFPLPSTVHFPGTLLPLHIFEPRYRTLVGDALAGDGRIAIALLKPGFEAEYYNSPEVYPIACAGRLVAHEKLPDGRFHILVEGLGRIQLMEQVREEPYRLFRAQFLKDQMPLLDAQGAVSTDASTLLACVRRVVNDVPEAAEAGKEILKLAEEPGLLADVVASIFVTEPADRQKLLETLDISERLRKATEAVGELILRLERAAQPEMPVN